MKALKSIAILIAFQFLASFSFAGQNNLPLLNCKFKNKNTLYNTSVNLNTNTIRFNYSPKNVKGNEYTFHYLNAYTMAFGEKGRINFINSPDNNSYIIHNDVAHSRASLFIISMNNSVAVRLNGKCSI